MRSDSVATAGEKRDFQTYLRRLSYRSERHPRAFQLCNVKDLPHEPEPCSHSGRRSRLTAEGGYGKVQRAIWLKPDETSVVVAIKTFRVSQQQFVVSSSRFESILV